MFIKTNMRRCALTALPIFMCMNSAYAEQYYDTCESPDTATATVNTVTRVTTSQTVRTISTAVARSFSNVISVSPRPSTPKAPTSGDVSQKAMSGMSGGDLAEGVSVWGTADFTHLQITPDAIEKRRRHTNITTVVGGLDKTFDSGNVFGIAASYSRADTDGSNDNLSDLDQSSNSYALTAYGAVPLRSYLYVDGLFGTSYSGINTEDENTGIRATSNNHSKSIYGALNVNYLGQLNDVFAYKAYTGLTLNKAWNSAYTNSIGVQTASSSQRHWQARLGGAVTAQVNDGLAMQASVTYERDKSIASIGENSVRLSLGGDYAVAPTTTLTFETMANVGRETQEELGLAINLRHSF